MNQHFFYYRGKNFKVVTQFCKRSRHAKNEFNQINVGVVWRPFYAFFASSELEKADKVVRVQKVRDKLLLMVVYK